MNKRHKYYLLTLTALLIAALLGSCSIREDNTDCPRPFRLFIKALDADGKDITDEDIVNEVILFVFNEKQEIVDVVIVPATPFRNRQPVSIALDYPGHQSLTFVAWGNVDNKVEFPQHASVKEWNQLYAKLKGQNGNAQSPGALFYGNLTVPVEYGGIEPAGDQTVEITHRTAQVTVTAINLKHWNGNQEGEYTYRLRDSHDTVDKDGNHTGEMSHCMPEANMINGTLHAPIFNVFPHAQRKAHTLEILFNGEVIYTAQAGTDGTPFITEPGRLLNIIIDFRAELSVKAVITPWNVVYQYVEM